MKVGDLVRYRQGFLTGKVSLFVIAEMEILQLLLSEDSTLAAIKQSVVGDVWR